VVFTFFQVSFQAEGFTLLFFIMIIELEKRNRKNATSFFSKGFFPIVMMTMTWVSA